MPRPPRLPSNPTHDNPISEPATESEPTTESDIPFLLTRLKDTFLNNAHLRKQHPSNPAVFLKSELDLHTALHSLSSVALTPGLYNPFLAHDGLTHLARLLHHPNDDILDTVISLLHDLAVDVDEPQPRIQMHDAMLEQGLLGGVADIFNRLINYTTDSEEQESRADALEKAFALFEDVLDGRPKLFARIIEKTSILDKCLEMIQLQPPVVGAAELLAVLTQEDANVKEMFIDADGMAIILKTAEKLKGGVEVIEDLFGVLCSVVLIKKGREMFVEEGGVPIVLEIMRKSRRYRVLALRSLDFACVAGGKAVRKIFEGGGLGILFAVLGTFEKGTWKEEEIRSMGESLFGILFEMLRYGERDERGRVLRKMREGGRVMLIVRIYTFFRKALGDGDLEEQMDKGLTAVQTGAVILGYVVAYGGENLRKAVVTILREIEFGVEDIIQKMREYCEGIENEEVQGLERKRIGKVVEDIIDSVGDAQDMR
eukprot:GFKZ01002847.1.p1 GENE.GFKZ01002847.1~~GFKZ01002847.1.p1  ORF type:complete len:497 (-),score=97.40 GFKZ01002847.1:2988-4442(-)